jgi:copper chaperone
MKTTRLRVDGMSCRSCIRHVREALSIDGVESVDVRLDEGAVVIGHSAEVLPQRLIRALGDAGYDARAA